MSLVDIKITNEKSLLNACDLLHDARCDLSSVNFDQAKGTWRATFTREFFEDPNLMQAKKVLFIFTRHTFPLAESVLELVGVTSQKIEDRSQIGTFMFNECQLVKGAYHLVFCEDMEITLVFRQQPAGRLRDLRLLDRMGTYLSFGNRFRRR